MDSLESWVMRLVQILFTAVLGHSTAHPSPGQVRRALERVGPPPVPKAWPWTAVGRAMDRFWDKLDTLSPDAGVHRRLAQLEVENADQARELTKLRAQTRATLRAKLDHFGDLAMEAVGGDVINQASVAKLRAALRGDAVMSRYQEELERHQLTTETLRRTENARAAHRARVEELEAQCRDVSDILAHVPGALDCRHPAIVEYAKLRLAIAGNPDTASDVDVERCRELGQDLGLEYGEEG